MFVHVSALKIYTVRLSIRPLIGVNNVKPMSGGRLKKNGLPRFSPPFGPHGGPNNQIP